MKTWYALALALLACGVLAYRLHVVERRLDALAADSRERAAAAASPAAERGLIDHDARLQDVESDLDEMRLTLAALKDETEGKADVEELARRADPERILEVVAQEVNRVRDRQLDYQRERWRNLRERAASDFAERHGLTSAQADEVRRLLVREIDEMIVILRSQETLDHPEQAVSDWTAMLEETDRSALRVLSKPQSEAWALTRALERAVWMPWLEQ